MNDHYQNIVGLLYEADQRGNDPLSMLAGFHMACTLIVDGQGTAEDLEEACVKVRANFLRSMGIDPDNIPASL